MKAPNHEVFPSLVFDIPTFPLTSCVPQHLSFQLRSQPCQVVVSAECSQVSTARYWLRGSTPPFSLNTLRT